MRLVLVTLEQEDSQWLLRNVTTGLYLSVEGEAGDGVSAVATPKCFRWDIWLDEEDQSTFRCALFAACCTSCMVVRADRRDAGCVGCSSRARGSTWT